MDITSSDLEISVEDNIWPLSDVNQWVGMRFRNLNIPVGAIIDTAYIQFTVDETESASAISIVYGEKNHNGTPFFDLPFNISARTKTTNQVTWNIPAWNNVGDAGVNQRTPDLKQIVQEIIDNTNWNVNNAMVFLIEGSGTRTAEAFDGEANKAPVLHISYHMVATTDVVENTIIKDVNIYPNPTSTILNIDLTSVSKNPTINIYSLSGKLVLAKQLTAETINTIDLKNAGLSKGVYIVAIKSEGLNITKKLIIK